MSHSFADRIMRPVLVSGFVGAVYLFLLSPVIVVVVASFDGGDPIAGRAFLRFPPEEFSLQWYQSIQPRLFRALGVSCAVAVFAALAGIAVGVPAALGLVRGRVRGSAVIGALFRAPLQIPFIVIGIAFIQTYYLMGDLVGLHLVGTFLGLAIGHAFVAIPYVVGSVGAVLMRFDSAYEEAALSLGASRWTAFRRVTLPIIMPGIYSGALFAFMVSFGDVPISLFLAGPDLTTLPLEIYHSMQFDFDAAILAISTLIVFGSMMLMWIVQRLIGLDVLLQSGGGR